MFADKRFILSLFFLLIFGAVTFARGEFVYNAKGKRNPFIPLVTSGGRLLKLDKPEESNSPGGLAVEGIIYDPSGRSLAIVNTNILGVGDMAGDYQVLKIQENKVIFIKDGEPIEVELNQEDI